MKRTITIVAVALAMAAICNVAVATTISWTSGSVGIKEPWWGGNYLEDGDLVQLWQDVDKDGYDPHGTVGGDDLLLDTSTIGTGFMTGPGEFYDDHTMTVNAGDMFYIRVFDNPAGTMPWYWNSFPVTAPATVPAVLAVNYVPIPEPSFMLVGGLVLLMVRRKKK